MNERDFDKGEFMKGETRDGDRVMGPKVVYDIHILFRNGEWGATRDGWEPGGLIGYGRTPVVALADLLEQEIEAE